MIPAAYWGANIMLFLGMLFTPKPSAMTYFGGVAAVFLAEGMTSAICAAIRDRRP